MDTPSAARIVVGVDGSEPSIEALRYAAKIARGLGCSLHAITTWEFPVTDVYPTGDWFPEKDAGELLASAIELAFGDRRPQGLTSAALPGGTARVLIEQSTGAEMLVLGSRGHGGFVGLLLGSVSTTCAAHAKCPVLVVHKKASDPG